MNTEVLQYLRCPVTHKPLRLVETSELERLNAQIDAGTLKNRSGQPLERRLEAALQTEDGTLIYPVWDDILTLIADEAIEAADERQA